MCFPFHCICGVYFKQYVPEQLWFSFPMFQTKAKKKPFVEDAIHGKPLAITETLFMPHRFLFPACINSIMLIRRFSVFSGVHYRKLFESITFKDTSNKTFHLFSSFYLCGHLSVTSLLGIRLLNSIAGIFRDQHAQAYLYSLQVALNK